MSKSKLVDLNSLQINQRISFTTKEPYDTVTRQGTIVSISNYEQVKTYVEDILPRFKAMEKKDPESPVLDELTFFVMKVLQGDKQATYVIAKEWIEPSSVIILDSTRYHSVRIYEVDDSKLQDALDLLRAHGFKCNREKN